MKHLSFILTLSLALSFFSQTALAGSWKTTNGTSSRFDITLGGGYSQLGYQFDPELRPSTLDARSIGSWNAKAHVGYKFFFTPWMGLGVGANFQRYGGGIELNGSIPYDKVTDTDGEQYNHTLTINTWQQREQLYILEVPVSLCFAIPVREVLSITLEMGGQYGIPMITNYKGQGELIHTGYYPQWHLTLQDQPDHGFYTETGFSPSGNIKTTNAWSVFGKMGVAVPLTDHLELLAQLYGHYYLTSPIVATTDGSIGFRNDRENMDKAHYFMSEYNSLHTTSIVKTNPKPFSVGLEIGLRIIIPHKTTHCLCKWYDNGPVTWIK